MRSAIIGALVTVIGAPASADACSYILGPSTSPRFPWWSATGFPTNGRFASSLEWRDAAGAVLPLEEDAELMTRIGLRLRVPLAPLPAGATFFTTEDCPPLGDCNHRLDVGAGPDTAPPSKAVLASVRTLLIRDPVGPGGFTCPDVDNIELKVEGTDDTTPREDLVIVAYVADTATLARTKSDIDVAFAFNLGPPDRALKATIAIGESVDRARDGEPFRSAEPFCFTVALMDWAGNVSERSETTCLDTTDEADPTVELIDGQGCACATGQPTRGRATPAFALALLLVLGARRRCGGEVGSRVP